MTDNAFLGIFVRTIRYFKTNGAISTLRKIGQITVNPVYAHFREKYNKRRLDEIVDRNISDTGSRKSIIFVGHDAGFFGAQLLALHIIKTLSQQFKYKVYLILKYGGELESQFRDYASVYNLSNFVNNNAITKIIEKLHRSGIDIAITNTVVCGDIAKVLTRNSIKTISLVHELPNLIKTMNIEENAKSISRYADKVIFPSLFVRNGFETIAPVDDVKVVIRPQGFYLKNKYKNRNEEARTFLRNFLNIEHDNAVVIGIGTGCSRKGIDLFIDTARKVNITKNKVYFVWIGQRDETFVQESLEKLNINPSEKNILFFEPRKDISFFYAGADLYLMTSREDPFPSVVLEAMEVGLPVIGFRDAGGFADIVSEDTGALVTLGDTDAMADKVNFLLSDAELRQRLGLNASKLIEEKFNFKDYIYSLLELFGHNYKKVSVVVPNYNYARYIKQRLQSIIEQTYPIYDIVVLDDNSIDNSAELIEEFIRENSCSNDFTFIQNDMNSGSVFKQWKKGVSHARGDYIWIAEADDLCERDFLEKVILSMETEDIVLGYSQSRQIDSDGTTTAANYLSYTNEIDKHKWEKNYSNSGLAEIEGALAVKNTIPNVSAVVFKKPEDLSVFDELDKFIIAGDWFYYTRLLEKGDIAFVAESLNYHRRHNGSVTISEKNDLHFEEIKSMQDYILKNFDVPEDVKAKALEYRKKVKQYLGVN